MDSTVDELRNDISMELVWREDLPQLQQFEGPWDQLWQYAKPQSQYIVLVAECTPMVGSQLVLDYVAVKKVTVVPVNCISPILKDLKAEHSIDNAVFVLSKDSTEPNPTEGPKKPRITAPSGFAITLWFTFHSFGPFEMAGRGGQRNLGAGGSLNRADALGQLHKYFKDLGITVPKPFDLSSIKDITDALKKAFNNKEAGKKPYKHTGELFQVDIEGALSHSLTMEIPVHKNIRGKALTALYDYLVVLHKYFPIKKSGKDYLKCIIIEVSRKNTPLGLTGQAFIGYVERCAEEHDPTYLEPDNGWVGCHGTFPMYRGYPCAMWTMFHTLVVQAYDKKARDPQEVLRAMKGYIGNFFGCSDCAQHFLAMAKNMEDEVKTIEGSVLWLWAAHNKANKRLHGDATEDPNFPKVQFPTEEVCDVCHDIDGEFNVEEVLHFLHEMYTTVQKVTPTQIGFNTSYIGH